MKINIHLFGASGRFGRVIAAMIEKSADMTLAEQSHADLFIDVTAPAALEKHVALALSHLKPIVIGTTGLADSDFALMKEVSQSIPLFYAPNFSLGMALLKKLTEETAKRFHVECSIDLIEEHHIGKKDAPSGAALMLKKALSPAPVQIHSLRTGQTIGTHTLCFNSAEEKITLSHAAHTRDAFARGCLAAARFLSLQPKGFYGMEDLLA